MCSVSVAISGLQHLCLAAVILAAPAMTHDHGTQPLSGGQPSWVPTFGGAPGTNESVRALEVCDDGSGGGPALYVGGDFTGAGGTPARFIAKWDGTSWSTHRSPIDEKFRKKREPGAAFDEDFRNVAPVE